MRPFLREPHASRASGHARARPPDVALLLAADPHHHRRIRLRRTAAPGWRIDTAPPPLLPNPPPVYSQMSTTCDGSMPTHRAMSPVRLRDALRGGMDEQLAVLANTPSRCAFPSGDGSVDCTTNVSSNTSAAALNPASEVAVCPLFERERPSAGVRSWPRRSPASVHLIVWSGGPPVAREDLVRVGGGGPHALPSSRAFGPSGLRLSRGSVHERQAARGRPRSARPPPWQSARPRRRRRGSARPGSAARW